MALVWKTGRKMFVKDGVREEVSKESKESIVWVEET